MTDKEIRDRILNILHRIAPEADLTTLEGNANLRETLDIDSFDFLNVAIAVQQEFGVNIPETDYRKVSDLNGMIDYILAKNN